MYALISAVVFQLTLRDVVTGIPHDVGAVIVYIILGLFLFGVWRGSKSGRAEVGAGTEERPEAQPSGSRKEST